MTSNNHWTEDNIPDQSGKVAIVTGANSGIGYEAARALAHKGATTILACRSAAKGQAAAKQIENEAPKGTAVFMSLDLSSLASVAESKNSTTVTGASGLPNVLIISGVILAGVGPVDGTILLLTAVSGSLPGVVVTAKELSPTLLRL